MLRKRSEMADIAVHIVLEKLVKLLVHETKLLRGIHREVESIRAELESIASLLKDADAREAINGGSNNFITTWLNQVQEVAYRIEDVMDEYTRHVSQRWFSLVAPDSVVFLLNKLKPRHELASRIEDIKKTLQEINGRAHRYGIISGQHERNNSQGRMHLLPRTGYDPRIASLFVDETKLVGIEKPRDRLLCWLSDTKVSRIVISVVGMGGLGKTTLAKKVYEASKRSFKCHAWITVSQSYVTEELLRSMMHQFYASFEESSPAKIGSMDAVQLISIVQEYVKQKRYLVVFDDVWSVDLWELMKLALPDNKKCSRIIFTTRNGNVASWSCSGGSLHNHLLILQPLGFKESWELFCRKVFCGRQCPGELKDLAMDIVKKCGGLPLAIVTVGGILSMKGKNVFEWRKFYDSFATKLESDEQLARVAKIISLSYYDLPHYLKSCLLYFGMFPEDYSILGSRLVRQWIAEGFVKARNNEVLEDVAEEYLTDLVQRSLIQESEVKFVGRSRSYRVHDLMREFLVLKSQEMSFGQVLDGKSSSTLDRKGRRLSISKITNVKVPKNVGDISTIRSVILFQMVELPKNFTSFLIARFKLMKMLDFEDAPLSFLPDEVGDLFHLKYLSIRNTKVKHLPKSIGKLQQLETLDMKQTLVRELPIDIKRLRSLRHLLACNVDIAAKGVKILGGLGCSETLQKLSFVKTSSSESCIVKDLRHFSQLRKLGMSILKIEDGTKLCNAIQNMKQLVSLEIHSLNLDLQAIVSPPPLLQTLILNGPLETIPNWISELQNLVKIRLSLSGLTNDPLQALQDLPNLVELQLLGDAYIGEKLHFQGGFRKLKLLKLVGLNMLKEVVIDKGAMNYLEVMQIGPIPLLREVPCGIQHLKKLKYLNFHGMDNEFCSTMHYHRGHSFWIVKHAPELFFSFPGRRNLYVLS